VRREDQESETDDGTSEAAVRLLDEPDVSYLGYDTTRALVHDGGRFWARRRKTRNTRRMLREASPDSVC